MKKPMPSESNELIKKFQLRANKDYRSVFLADSGNVEGLLADLCKYWNIAKTVLEAAKMINPANTNRSIDSLCDIIDRLCRATDTQTRAELLERFGAIWEVVRPKLVAAKLITGPKVEAIMDEVIRICDALAS